MCPARVARLRARLECAPARWDMPSWDLARYSCAPASYRIGRDGACTRLLLDGQEERDENV